MASPFALNNPHASPEAVRLFRYLHEIRGKFILSGQQEVEHLGLHDGDDVEYVKATTGKLPAILGLDYISYPDTSERAIEWWRRGGIVSLCWHWGAPGYGPGYPASKETIDVDAALTPGTELNRILMQDIDDVARELLKLRDAHVPVLWRPLHEFSGDWFWWSKSGPEPFKRLWRLIHDRYTRDFGLDNLVWVLGYTSQPGTDWYPGDEYVDIAGADNYATGPQAEMYRATELVVGPERLIAYHECGPIPPPDELVGQQIPWSWFLTWHTIHIREQNTPEYLRAVNHHPYVITHDKLPYLK